MYLKFYLLIACCGLLVAGRGWSAENSDAAGVVIVVNSAVPESVALGQYYAERRGIPIENIIELPLSTAETISPSEYVATLHNPLLAALREKGWIQGVQSPQADWLGREGMSVALHSIRYLVTLRGVPLRISNDPALFNAAEQELPQKIRFNRAAVDSELALLVAPAGLPLAGFVPNPLWNQPFGTGTSERVIRVSRIDGPSYADLRRMIDRSLQAEERGLIGRAYFDLGGPHAKGDDWIRRASELAREAYFDVTVDSGKRMMDYTDRLDAPAIYMGWYRPHAYGPWRAPRWSVPAGAIGFHLHSFSAPSVRQVSQGWLAAFVAQGYCATMGNVFEPYLGYTHRPDRMLQYLLEGHSFGEAAFSAMPVLSWMGVAIGDPLYRPFKQDLAAQLQLAAQDSLSPYLISRELNRLQAKQGPVAALDYARQQFKRQPSLVLAARLAQLYVDTGQPEAAVDVLGIARYLSVFAAEERVLAQEIADGLYRQDQVDLALLLYQRLLQQADLDPVLELKLLQQGAEIARAAQQLQQAQEWTAQAEQLSSERAAP